MKAQFMKTCLTSLAVAGGVLAAVLPTASVDAAPGRLSLLPLGTYVCALPGDADGAAFVVLPEREFTIRNGSTYRAKDGNGTYLLAGNMVTFTRGPMKNMKLIRTGTSVLQHLDDSGKPGRMRCVHKIGAR